MKLKLIIDTHIYVRRVLLHKKVKTISLILINLYANFFLIFIN